MENLLAPEIVEEVLGELEIKGVFKTTKTETICGGEVKSGKLSIPALARLKKGKEVVADNLEITNLKSGPSDVKEVLTGQMCGLSLKTTARIPIEIGDTLEFFTRQTKTRSL